MKKWLFLVLGLLILFACQENEEGTSSTVAIRLSADPDRLLPLLARTSYAQEVNSHLFLPLLDFDPNTFELVPVLANDRPAIRITSDGSTTYTFSIRPEAHWDNGRPVTAKDYLFTLKVIFHPEVSAARFRAYLDCISRIELSPEDPQTFTVYTDEPYILAETVLGNFPLLPAYHYDPEGLLESISLDSLLGEQSAKRLLRQKEELKRFATRFQSDSMSHKPHLIRGCGPYRLVEWNSNQRLVLEKKSEWWGEKLEATSPLLTAHPDRLIYRIIPEISAATNLLRNQEIDVLSDIDPSVFTAMKRDSSLASHYHFFSPVMPAYAYLGMQRDQFIFSDRNVRRALAHLTDVPTIINEVFNGLAKPIVGPFHPDKPYYHDGLPLISYDPQRAARLLTAAGWEDRDQDGILEKEVKGRTVEFSISLKYSSQNEPGKQVALLLQEAARKAGIRLAITPLPFNQLIEDYRRRDFDLVMLSWRLPPIPDDPRQLWHTDSDTPSGSNRVGFGNAASDALIDSIGKTLDPQLRLPLYQRFQEMIYEDQPYIFLYTPLHRIAIHQRFSANAYSLSPGYFPGTFVEK